MADDLYDVTVTRADGTPWSLWELHGQVVLLVTLHGAAKSTVQLVGIDKLQKAFAAQGLTVVGVPMSGEPATGTGYEVSFPVTAPAATAGVSVHPLFEWLRAAAPGPYGSDSVNGYTKFLIGRDGAVLARFEPSADAKELIAAVQQALAAPVPAAPPRPAPAADPVAPAPGEPVAGQAPAAATTPTAPSALEPPRHDPSRLPVPAPPADPEADIVDAELVEDSIADLQVAVEVAQVEADLAREPESSMGADLMDIADELRGLEVDSQLLAEQERPAPPPA